MRAVLLSRLLSRMAPKPRPVNNFSNTTARSASETTTSIPRSETSDSDELEVLGIKTWTGKAVFVKPEADREEKPGSSVNDLANQLIDLTFSPTPSKRTQEITRPRGVAHFASPSARTAFSPTKKPVPREVFSKPIHPFFKHSIPERRADSARLEQSRGVNTYRKPQQAKKNASTNNPFISPPVSPTLSTASIESSPIQPPPASQRPRLAPPSSPSSCGSPSSITSTFNSTFTHSRSPSPTKPLTQSPLAQKPRATSSSPSPLRVISPSVKNKPLSPGQKTFKPTFNPVPNRSSPVVPKQAAGPHTKHQQGQSPWKWTKWGWTQQLWRSSAPHPVVQTKPGDSFEKKEPTIDPLVMSMQNLGIEKRVTRSTATSLTGEPTPAPPAAPPLRKFSHKTWHVGNPLFKKPPTLAYTTDPAEANKLLGMVKGEAIAFDMEWPFSFKRGNGGGAGKTALVQVGDEKLIVLVHLSLMKGEPLYDVSRNRLLIDVFEQNSRPSSKKSWKTRKSTN